LYYQSVPICVERVWGHDDLKKLFNCNKPEPVGEIWILSGYPGHETKLLKNGKEEVKINEFTKEQFGTKIPRFPLLIKLLKAKRWLSIQVHPDDDYAIKEENEPWGKNEAWYFLECEQGARIINGINVESKSMMSKIVEKNEFEKVLNYAEIFEDGFIYLKAGIVHALGPGALTLEVQQTSDLTYRLYDWGSDRELHIKKALEVIDYKNPIAEVVKLEDTFSAPYFKVTKINKEAEINGFSILFTLNESIVDGNLLKKYSCAVVPFNSKANFKGSAVEFRLGEFWNSWLKQVDQCS